MRYLRGLFFFSLEFFATDVANAQAVPRRTEVFRDQDLQATAPGGLHKFFDRQDNATLTWAVQTTGTRTTAPSFGPTGCSIAPGGVDEGEPCGDDLNGGCITLTGDVELSDGNTGTGTVWADAGMRDLDFWRVTVSEPSTITFSIESEMPVLVGLAEDPAGDCSTFLTVDTRAILADCSQVDISRNVIGGTYYLFVGIGDASGGIFGGFPCSGADDQEYNVAYSAVALTDCLAPTGAPEVEGCGDTTNDGCDVSAMGVLDAEVISVGDTIFGTLFSELDPMGAGVAPAISNLDVYTFTTSGPREITVEVTSEMPVFLQIATADCGVGLVGVGTALSGTATQCDSDTTTAVVGAGDHAILVGLGDEFGFLSQGVLECSSGVSAYEFTITDAAPPAACPLTALGQAETEACGGDTNGGCNSPAMDQFEIAVGSLPGSLTLSGEIFNNAVTRDTDWWALPEITEVTEVTISAEAQFPAAIFLINDECGALSVIEALNVADCVPDTGTTVVLPPGNYVLFVSSGDTGGPIFSGSPCGTNNRYNVTIDVGLIDIVGCPLVVDAIPEMEVCGGEDNNLCLTSTGAITPAEPILLGQRYSGTLDADGFRDFDFFEFEIDFDDTELDITYNANIPSSLSIVTDDGTCPVFITEVEDAIVSDGDCVEMTLVTPPLPAGVYLAVVTVGTFSTDPIFAGYPCILGPDLNDYYFCISGGGGFSPPGFTRGDANADGNYDIADAIFTLSALFVFGSPQPICLDAADANADMSVNIADAIFTLTALFVSGDPPPFPCGTYDIQLGCDSFPRCSGGGTPSCGAGG